MSTDRIVADPQSGLAAASYGAYAQSVYLFDPSPEDGEDFARFYGSTGEQVEGVSGTVAHMFEGPSLLVENGELSVVEFTAEDLAEAGGENSITPARTLVPPSERTNTSPQPSPDGAEIVFLSGIETGDAGWYRVPFDGSADPEKIADVPVEHLGSTVIAWQ